MLDYNHIYKIGIQLAFEAAALLDKYENVIPSDITQYNQLEDKKLLRKICNEGAEILDNDFNTNSGGDFFRIAELAQIHEHLRQLSPNYKEEIKNNREFRDYAYMCETTPQYLEINSRVALYNYQHETKSNPIIDAYFDSENEYKTQPTVNGNYTVENLINYTKDTTDLKLLHNTYLNEQFKNLTNDYNNIPSYHTRDSEIGRNLEKTIGSFLYCHDAARETFPAKAYILAKALGECKENGLLDHKINDETMKETGFRVHFDSEDSKEPTFLKTYDFIVKTEPKSISIEHVIGEHGNIFVHGSWENFAPDDTKVHYLKIKDDTQRESAEASLKKLGFKNVYNEQNEVYIISSKEDNYQESKKFEGILKNAVIDLMKERKDTCSTDKENGVTFSTYGFDSGMQTAVWNVLSSAGVKPSYYSGKEVFINKDKSKQRLFDIINETATPKPEISQTEEPTPVSNNSLLKAIKGL